VCLLGTALLGGARAAEVGPWSATLYAGPATNNYTSQIFSGHLDIRGAMVGLAIDRNLFDLGAGFRLVGEAQAAHYFLDPSTSTFAVGLGLKYDRLSLGADIPVAVALYLGPSYSIDPPQYATDSGLVRYRFLNYFASEATFGVSPHWNISLRTFHRSGMYGLYARDVDEGTMIGVGIRHIF